MQPHEGKLARRLIANTLLNFLGQLYVLVLGFAVVPYVVHRLGPELYGVLAMVAVLGGFGTALNLGMGTALAKYTSELYWQHNFRRICVLVQTAVTICAVAGLFVCWIVMGTRTTLATLLFHGDATIESVVGMALYVTGFGFLFSLVSDALAGIPIGMQRFDIFTRMNVLVATVRNLGMVLILALGLYAKAILLVYFLSGLVGLMGYAYHARRLIPGLSLRPRLAWAEFRQLVGFSAPVLLAGISALVVYRLDRVLVAYFLPISAVTFYMMPYMLAEKTSTAVSNVTSVVFPLASELFAMQAREKLRELYVRATKMAILVGLPVTTILLALPAQILQWWVGPEFAARGVLTLRLLAVGFLFNILGYVPFVVAQGMGQPWVSTNFALVNGAINLALFLLLIPRFGIVGAAAGFLLSEVVVIPFLIGKINRVLGVSWRLVISRSYLRPFACGLVAFGVLRVFQAQASSLLRLILCFGLGLLTYALLAFATVIDKRERIGMYDQVLSFLRLRGSAIHVE